MKAQITYSKKIKLSPETEQKIQKIVQWEETPNTIITGRSGYLKLDQPLPTANIQLIKFKGLGYFDTQTNTLTKPGTDIYDGSKQKNDQGLTELANRLIVNKNGSFELVQLEEKPFGGQYLERVDIEFNTAETLCQPSSPLITYLPIAKAHYEEIQFNQKPIGVTVLGLPTPNLTFLEEYFIFQLQEDRMMMSNRLNPRSTPDQIFELLTGFCHQTGHKIRLLHNHFVGIEGHLANLTVIPETAEILIHDLDYVSPTTALTPIQEFNYRIRDIASCLTAFITNILFNDLLHFASQLEKYNANFFYFNMITAFLEGYHDDLPDHIQQKIEDFSDQIWKEILQFYLEKLQKLPPRDRLLTIHPFVVQKKLEILDALYPFMTAITKTESKPLTKYSEQDHHKNLENLFASLKK